MFSSTWYRVAGLKPKLRGHAHISRHYYREKLWYVLHDKSSGKNHRFSPEVHYIISLMDGQRSVQDIWDLALEHQGDDAPTQDEMIRLLAQLHSSDLLLCDVPPDSRELFQRFERKQFGKWKQRLWSPLSVRFPLWDPDKFLDRWLFLVRPLFGWTGLLFWCLTILSAVVLAASHWTDLSKGIADRVLAPDNILLMIFIYPLVKMLHELGHAFSTKIRHGEVHEMGIMFLIFMPIPYVDASSSWSFRDRKKRFLVSAAGILVELFLAAVALFVWLNVEQGMVKAVAYNVMLIGGVSTLLFNGNPLLKFDGYYMLADVIEMPNLASRSNNYIGYLIKHYIFGVSHESSPAETIGERLWFTFYSCAAFSYRMFISFTIILFVAGKFFVVGIILAIWAVSTMLLVPLSKQIKFLFNSPVIQQKRVRAIVSSSFIVTMIFSFLLLFPMSLSTYTEGVIWLPEQAKIKVLNEGFVTRLVKDSNSLVKNGETIIELNDPLLTAEKEVLNYRKKEFQAKLKKAWIENRVQTQILREQIKVLDAELEEINERISEQLIQSPRDGFFIIPQAEDIAGRFFRKGDLIGYIVDYPLTKIRTVITQDDIGLVRKNTKDVEIRMAENIKSIYKANIIREVPAATDRLPSPVLGFAGGGKIPVDPSDKEGLIAYEPVFQMELQFPLQADAQYLGERVYVRFIHEDEPLAFQWARLLRQLFLRQFGV